MSERAATRLAWSLWGLCVALVLGSAIILAMTHGTHVESKSPGIDFVLSMGLLAFPTVGALVASRKPGNIIGWLLLGVGLTFQLAGFAQEYAIQAVFAAPGSLPGGEIAAWISEWIFLPAILACTLVLLLFPHGRLLSRRWRSVVWVTSTAAMLLVISGALTPGSLPEFTSLNNPAGITGAKTVLEVLGGIGWTLTLVGVILAAASVVLRFRRAQAEEREQLKWIAAGAVVLAILWIVAFAVQFSQEVGDAIFLAGLTAFPLCVGVAILRYRLYDIDRIINRALVYGALTAGLAGLYFGVVIALQAVFSGLTRGSDLAIAGSTLAVAALFRPARQRIQAVVDRRFYRQRYDAQRTLEAFSARLRDEVDLDTLGAELHGIVQDTMQPAHVSLWLREPEVER